MSALDFINALVDTGRVRVAPSPEPPERLDQAVRELDRLLGVDLPPGRPRLVLDAGEWALLLLYRACQSLVYRDINAEAVREALAQPCPGKASPEVCYSVDLAFRFLPDVLKLARGIAQDDPLVAGVVSLLAAWPLSSVGAAKQSTVDVATFIAHPVLRGLYVDRIIDRADVGRLDHPQVRETARAALGAFPHLAPQVAAALEQENQRARES